MGEEQLANGRTPRRVLTEESVGHQAQARIVQPLPRHKVWIGRHDRLVQLRGGFVFTPPWKLTGDDFVNDDTKGPHIRWKTIGIPKNNLGGCRLGSTETVRLSFGVKAREALVGVFFKGASSAAVR